MRQKVITLSILLLGVVLTTVGITKWFTTESIIEKQEKAAHAFLERAMNDENLAPGLENSPRLLKVIFLAAGVKRGAESSITIFAAGLISGSIGIFLYKRTRKGAPIYDKIR